MMGLFSRNLPLVDVTSVKSVVGAGNPYSKLSCIKLPEDEVSQFKRPIQRLG